MCAEGNYEIKCRDWAGSDDFGDPSLLGFTATIDTTLTGNDPKQYPVSIFTDNPNVLVDIDGEIIVYECKIQGWLATSQETTPVESEIFMIQFNECG